MMSGLELSFRTSAVVLLLGCVAMGVLLAGGVSHWWRPVSALLRAAFQLTALSLILVGVITDPLWVAIALVVMFAVAVFVAARRGAAAFSQAWRTGAAMAIGVGTAGVLVFASGAVDLTPRYALAVGAMILGNAMSVAALTGRQFAQARLDRWAEVEAWLALGASPWQATIHLGRIAVNDALIPGLDQTRTTGLVVLPGAFIGAIFGGLSPVEAGRFQLVVLAAILAAGTITAVLTVGFTSSKAVRPPPPR